MFSVVESVAVLAFTWLIAVQPPNKWIRIYYLLPLVLIWAYAAGELLQEFEKGPAWAQNHLHNLGAAFLGVFFTFWFLPRLFQKYSRTLPSQQAVTKAVVNLTLWGWTGGVIACCAQEIAMVTLWRENTIANRYSGNVDWLDIAIYLISEALIILNYIYVGKLAIRKTADRYHRPRY